MSDVKNNEKGSIFLIGPMGTGKSATGRELSKIFASLKYIDVDSKEVRFDFWRKHTDYSSEVDSNIRKEQGFLGQYKYWKKYEAELVNFLLRHDDNKAIVDFGAGQTVYESQYMLRQIQKAFSTKNNIFLILPCEDREECQRQLEERMEKRKFEGVQKRHPEKLTEEEIRTGRIRVSDDEYKLNQHFLDSISNRSLATHIIYTNGASPKEIARTIAEVYLGMNISSDKAKVVLNKERKVHIDDKRGESYGD